MTNTYTARAANGRRLGLAVLALGVPAGTKNAIAVDQLGGIWETSIEPTHRAIAGARFERGSPMTPDEAVEWLARAMADGAHVGPAWTWLCAELSQALRRNGGAL